MSNSQPSPESHPQNGFRIGKSQKSRLLAGHVIDGRFEIVELVGDGSLSSVHKSRDLHHERLVAVKLLHTAAITDYDEIVRLKKEGRILSGLDCLNIAKVYQFGLIEEKLPYVVAEFLIGFNLKQILDTRTEPLGADIAIYVGLSVCDALIAAHAAGVVHGDLKPSNIMIVEEEAGEVIKVTDFGIARNLATTPETIASHLTETGLLTTSVPYMSPERCVGNPIDERSDVYSLGCLLYEMLTGRPPFLSHDPVAVAQQHVRQEVSFHHVSNALFEDELKQVIHKAIAKEPSARHENVAQLRDALALIKGEPDQGEPDQNVRIIPRRKRASAEAVRLALLVATAAGVAIAAFCWLGK